MEFSGMITSVSFQTVPSTGPDDLVNVVVTTEGGGSHVFVLPASQAPAVGTPLVITVALA